jgi:apolipoprotein N-acyltransferase
MADVENPNPDLNSVQLGKAEAGKGIRSLCLCAVPLVTWTILAAVGLVVFFCPAVHARTPKAARVLASIGLFVAFVGFAAEISWCSGVICPGNDDGPDW